MYLVFIHFLEMLISQKGDMDAFMKVTLGPHPRAGLTARRTNLVIRGWTFQPHP